MRHFAVLIRYSREFRDISFSLDYNREFLWRLANVPQRNRLWLTRTLVPPGSRVTSLHILCIKISSGQITSRASPVLLSPTTAGGIHFKSGLSVLCVRNPILCLMNTAFFQTRIDFFLSRRGLVFVLNFNLNYVVATTDIVLNITHCPICK